MKQDYLHQDVEETEHVEQEDVVKPKKKAAEERKEKSC